MTWLSGYSDANRVDDGEDQIVRRYYGPTVASQRVDVVKHYRYVGMTYAAAVTCRDALNDPLADPPIVAQLEKEGPGGNWQVSVHETTYGDWEDID